MPHATPLAELQDLGQAQYRRREYNAALISFTHALNATHEPSASLLDNRAATLEKLDDFQSALKDARTTIKLYEKDVTGYLRAGKLLQKMGKHALALEIYKLGMKKKPEKVELLQKMHSRLTVSLSPPTSVDPFSQLPLELVEFVLSYLSFRQIVNCTRVSKQWKDLVVSLPSLWQSLDLSGAKKTVKSSFVTCAVNRSKGQMTSASLNRLYDSEKIVHGILKSCRSLHSLEILDGGIMGTPLIDNLVMSSTLTSLKLGPGAEVGCDTVSQILTRCPALNVLECQAVIPSRFPMAWPKKLDQLQILKITKANSRSGQLDVLDMHELCDSASELRSLAINGWRCLTHLDMGLRKLANLQDLDFTGCYMKMPSGGFPPSLRSLVLGTTPGVEDPINLDYYFLPNLESLSCPTGIQRIRELLSAPDAIREYPASPAHKHHDWSALHTLRIPTTQSWNPPSADDLCLPRLKALKHLQWSRSNAVDDRIANAIVANHPRLCTLDLSGTTVTGVGLKALVNGLGTTLEAVDVSGCKELGVDAVEWARAQGVRITYRLDEAGTSGRTVRYA